MGGRGKEGEPINWTGWVCVSKRDVEENPDVLCVTYAASGRKTAEVIEPYAAKKSLSPEAYSARTANRHW